MYTLRLTSCLFILLLFFDLQAQAQQIDIYSRPERSERSHDFDVLHYRIELAFEEETRSIFGKTGVTLRSLRDGFNHVALDAETYEVTKVTLPDGSPLSFNHEDGTLDISLNTERPYNDTLTLVISYEGHNFKIDPTAYGQPASYNVGIDFKSETDTNPQLINTLSFPEGARHWFPSYDHPSDRATQETIITIREDYLAISNGRLVSRVENNDGTQTFHWSLEKSHPTYLFVMVAGPYVGIEDSYGDIPVTYWVYPDKKDDALRSFGRTPEILAFMEDTYGVPYPWPRYDQIQLCP